MNASFFIFRDHFNVLIVFANRIAYAHTYVIDWILATEALNASPTIVLSVPLLTPSDIVSFCNGTQRTQIMY